MPGLPLLKAPFSIAGGGAAQASASSQFSTRISSRQSQSQGPYVPSVAPVLNRPLGARGPQRAGTVRASLTAQPGVERGASALLLAPDEFLGLPIEGSHEQQQPQQSQQQQQPQQPRQGVPVSNRTQRHAASRRALAEKKHQDSADASSSRAAGNDQTNDASRGPGWASASAQQALEGLPEELHCLLDVSAASAVLPPPGTLDLSRVDNTRIDRLVAALGRGRSTWRRSLQLYEWLKSSNYTLDDRVCTTLIRVCADHGDAVSALNVYEWMRAPVDAGGGGLQPTAYTYTAAMRAALGVGMLERAMQVWSDSQAANLTPDCRLCITYIEVCTKLGLTDQALSMYAQMRDAPPGSPMRPSVHAYTAAMRAASEGGQWVRALGVWEDMRRSGCQPTGHAYAAAIGACAAGQDWQRAVALFDDMTSRASIRPDVVSCTALVSALASAGEADKAEAVVTWMQKNGLKPNVRTFTALLTAMGNAQQWQRAVRLLFAMQQPENGSVQALGEHGQWQLAEAVFEEVEAHVRDARLQDALAAGAATAAADATARSRRNGAAQRLLKAAATAEAAAAAAPAAVQAAALQQLGALGMLASGALNLPQLPQLAQLQQPPAQPPLLPLEPLHIPPQGYNSPGSPQTTTTTSPSYAPSPSGTSGSAATPSSASTSSQGQTHALHDWQHPSELNGIQVNLHRRPSLEEQQLAMQQAASETGSASALQPPIQQGYAAVGEGPQWGGSATQQADPFEFGFSLTPAPTSARHQQAPIAGSMHIHSTTGAAAGADGADAQGFSFFSAPPSARSTAGGADPAAGDADAATPRPAAAAAAAPPAAPLVNDVVCGALMLAYERAGKWIDAVNVLSRARMMGVSPSTAMVNIAVSAAGKAGQLEVAEQLFQAAPSPDMGTYEAMLAAYGMAGRPDKAEQLFRTMVRRGLRPRDYAYCGLITAYSMAGDTDAALAVRRRMQRDGHVAGNASVHVYNALLAACERGARFDTALELLQTMKREGVETNNLTQHLMAIVGRHGVQTVENQQMAAAALSAVFAAAGGLLIRAGLW